MKAGIDVINNIDTQKFPLVLNRVAQSMQNRTDIYKPFSEEDKDRLATALNVSQPDLELMLDCSTFILQQVYSYELVLDVTCLLLLIVVLF